ncbi:MAG: septum formation initiator family protein, partial [Oscillospiraceae bacterium]
NGPNVKNRSRGIKMTDRMTAEKRRHSKLIRRRKIILFVCTLICVYFLFSIAGIQIEIYKENQKLNEIVRKINTAQLENDELSRIVLNGGEADYIERIAREKLGYAAADERVFEDMAGS